MSRVSRGGGAASRVVYRHPLLRLMIPLLAPLAARAGWSDVALAVSAVLMGWSPCPTLAQRFEWTRAVLDAALPRRRRVGRTFQGFVKALGRRSTHLLDSILPRLREETRRAAGRSWWCGEFVPFGADGSKFNAPRTISNEDLGVGGKDKSGPQMMMLLLVHLGCMLPWAWKCGGARDPERTLLRGLLDLLPEKTLLVADAGFTGFELLSEFQRRGVHFLIRVGRGVELLRELGYHRREGKGTIYLWPDKHRRCRPLILRLIRVGEVYLISDVTDPGRLSRKMAAELYRRRWGLEVAYRTLKQTLEHRAVRSAAATNARRELDWAVVSMWMLGLVGGSALRAAGIGPRRLSYAAALKSVRHAAHARVPLRTLRGRLRSAVIDSYTRRGSKKAWRWPHKKRQAPPGAPEITRATRRQVRLAKALRCTSRRE